MGCHGYLHTLLEARILFSTTTHFHRHLPQAYLLVMSLIIIITLECKVQFLKNLWCLFSVKVQNENLVSNKLIGVKFPA